MRVATDNLHSDSIILSDKQDDTGMDTSLLLDSNTTQPPPSDSYDPMLISELDDPPQTNSTTTITESIQRVLPVNTYGHSRETANHSKRTRFKSDIVQRPVFEGVFYWINPLMTRPLRNEVNKTIIMLFIQQLI
jgi:hypothetical protein